MNPGNTNNRDNGINGLLFLSINDPFTKFASLLNNLGDYNAYGFVTTSLILGQRKSVVFIINGFDGHSPAWSRVNMTWEDMYSSQFVKSIAIRRLPTGSPDTNRFRLRVAELFSNELNPSNMIPFTNRVSKVFNDIQSEFSFLALETLDIPSSLQSLSLWKDIWNLEREHILSIFENIMANNIELSYQSNYHLSTDLHNFLLSIYKTEKSDIFINMEELRTLVNNHNLPGEKLPSLKDDASYNIVGYSSGTLSLICGYGTNLDKLTREKLEELSLTLDKIEDSKFDNLRNEVAKKLAC